MKIFIVCISLIIASSASGQRSSSANDMELKKLFIGVNSAGYFANKNTANFYNGFERGGIARVINTQVYKDQIDQQLIYDWTFGQFPEEMKYSVALQLGVHLGYHVNENFALIADVDIINLKVKDFVTFSIDDPNNGSPEPTIETMPILGEEKRLNINVGFQNYLSEENNTFFYWSMALNVSSTKFVNNTMKVRQNTYYIGDPLWVGNVNAFTGAVVNENGRTKPGGIGFGGVAGIGVKFKFNPNFIFDLGYNLNYSTINLTDYQLTNKTRGVHHSLFVRIIRG